MKITIEIDEEDLIKLMKKNHHQQGEHWMFFPSWTRDITPTYKPTQYTQKYPCEITSSWDKFDSFHPQNFPMTID